MQKTMVSGSQGRVEHIDLFRGIGVLLMILGHLGLGKAFDHYIHGFHMPMFFFVSGYFFKPAGNTLSFLRKKARALLLPYAVFGAGHYLVNIAMGGDAAAPLKHLLFVNTIGLPITGAIWFLTALFFTELAYHLLDKFLSGRKSLHLAIVVVALAGNLLPKVLPFRLPWAMDAGFVGVGLYHLGRLFKTGLDRESAPAMRIHGAGAIACIAVLAGSGILIFLNGYVNMRAGNYGILPLFWINALLSTLAGMNLCRRYFEARGADHSSLMRLLLRLGRNSIVFLCTNEFFLYGWEKLLRRLADLPAAAEKIIVFFAAMVCMFIAERILTGTRLRVLIGRR